MSDDQPAYPNPYGDAEASPAAGEPGARPTYRVAAPRYQTPAPTYVQPVHDDASDDVDGDDADLDDVEVHDADTDAEATDADDATRAGAAPARPARPKASGPRPARTPQPQLAPPPARPPVVRATGRQARGGQEQPMSWRTILAFASAAMAIAWFPIVFGPLAIILAGLGQRRNERNSKIAQWAGVACALVGFGLNAFQAAVV